jgi:hypothetical protein
MSRQLVLAGQARPPPEVGVSMRYAFALLALAQLAIGAAAIFARFALAGGGPIAVSALRLLVAALPVAVFAGLRGAYRRHDGAT